ncbi:hypothetical protein [Microbulbifer spongiae]|uniref:Uncharacterized protein n=1 Tax=Microbulbifer spongiae TaxID=2944933 RepID=A0ABY9EHF5_9GAMM|nr:hypothetical protein [Microbulbifer sp. MI-G]WKD51259.1 hypothetical protein M8T91_07535 [Microbulbifer sp. MI-G]
MKTGSPEIIPLKRGLLYVVLATALIVLIPLIAMQLIQEMQWDIADFMILGGITFALGSLFILVARKMPRKKLLIGVIFLLILCYLWAELAVGIFTRLGS